MTGPLWKFDELVEVVRGRPVGDGPNAISGLSIDSRTVGPGEAFLAIRGDRFDGHDFVGKAMAQGAAVAIVSQDKLARLGHITDPLLVVDDVAEALKALAVAARARMAGKVIAVTGSAGKTTTKDMLRHALAPSGSVHGAPASFNNHWGVPLTLARMPVESDFGVFEIGMNHPGEITPLVAMVRPHAAIVTTVAAGHLGAFDNVEGIARAKAEIFSGVESGGAAIINRDNPHYELLRQLASEAGVNDIIGFGETSGAEIRLEDAVLGGDRSEVRASILGRPISYTLGVPGAHIVSNSLAVLAAVAAAGADVEAAAATLATFGAGKGRGQRFALALPAGSAILIDESYNANPASMRAALSVLGTAEPGDAGRRIAVLGDMLELGDAEASFHAELADPIAVAQVDQVNVVGARMAALWDVLPSDRRGVYASTATDLIAVLADDLRPGDVVMVKGSNAVGLGAVVAALRERFA